MLLLLIVSLLVDSIDRLLRLRLIEMQSIRGLVMQRVLILLLRSRWLLHWGHCFEDVYQAARKWENWGMVTRCGCGME